jgi:DNA (cytosine-5)-methyltransferase 1
MTNSLIHTKEELMAPTKSRYSFGAIYGGAGFPLLAAAWAGLITKWQIEPRPYFNIKTFRNNFSDVMYSTELEAFYSSPVDVIWGSPSCGEISSSTRNSKNAKTMAMKSFGDFEYVKFIKEVINRKPKIFVLENIPSVKNFVQFNSTPAGFILKHQISKEEVLLHDYYIEEHRITPTEVGIPQTRDRLFTIGSRFPYRFMLNPPDTDYKSQLSIEPLFRELDELRKKGVYLHNDGFPKHSEDKIEKMSRIRPGEGLYGGINNKRLDPSKNSPVIMSSATRYIHPWENRLLTCRESACLMGIPLDFVFVGSENRVLDQTGKGIVAQVGLFILKQIRTYLEMEL